MNFPLTFWDVSLWLAITAIILLATSELLSTHKGEISVLIEKNRLRKVALIVGVLFILTVFIRFYEILAS
jgi:hypothetical protein